VVTKVVRGANDEDDTDNHDDQLLAVDKFPAKYIAQKAEGELSDDVADVRRCVDSTSEKKWVDGGRLVARALQTAPVSKALSVSPPQQIQKLSEGILVSPDWSDQIDDEQVV